MEDLDTDNTTKPELAVLAVNHHGTKVKADYRIHFYTGMGPAGAYTESPESSDPMRDVKLCSVASCGGSAQCCTALTFAGWLPARPLHLRAQGPRPSLPLSRRPQHCFPLRRRTSFACVLLLAL